MFRIVSVAVIGLVIGVPAVAARQVPAAAPLPSEWPAPAGFRDAPVPPQPLQAPPPGAPTPRPSTQMPQAEAPRAQPPSEQPPRKARGRDLNLQVELTITDQTGSAPPDKKVVSMIVADATFGRIRSVVGNGISYLNVDARPQVMEGDRILVELTVEYTPAKPEGTPTTRYPAALNESLTIILQNGKPLTVSQAADPVTDRKMTVEIRASILK